MGQTALEIGVSLCKKWEGLAKLGKDGLVYPYLCPAGYWTIGYGTTRLPDGSRVTKDTVPVTPEQAEEFLLWEAQRCLYQVLRVSPILTQSNERLGAITSFVYNLGISRYINSTLRRRINEQNWPAARSEIQRWVYAAGKRLPGLIARRREEAELLNA